MTEEDIRKNAHIPNEELKMDIADTLSEIEQYERELEAYRGDPVKNRLPIYMAEGQISRRKVFVSKLNEILTHRTKFEELI